MAKTLVILPGWGQSSKNWQEMLQKLETDMNVLVLDLPGFGKQPLVADDWGIPEYAGWVQAQLESLQLTEVILLGHSFGGRIAAYLASQQPEWLHGLILYGAPTLYRPGAKTKLKGSVAKILKTVIPSGWHNTFYSAELKEAEASGKGKIFRQAVQFDQSALLPQIRVPTFLVWGELDTEAPLYIAQATHELVPNSQLHILPGLGHNVHIENANLFYGTIKKILKHLE